jgi:hypothetical protein
MSSQTATRVAARVRAHRQKPDGLCHEDHEVHRGSRVAQDEGHRSSNEMAVALAEVG